MTVFPKKTPLLKQRDAQSNALSGDDVWLRVLLEAWADLPESVMDAVLKMVRVRGLTARYSRCLSRVGGRRLSF